MINEDLKNVIIVLALLGGLYYLLQLSSPKLNSFAANTPANIGLCKSEGGTWTGTCCSCPNRFCKNKCGGPAPPRPNAPGPIMPARRRPVIKRPTIPTALPKPATGGCGRGGSGTEGASIGGGFVVDHGPEDRAQWSAKHGCLLGEEASAYFCINPAAVTDAGHSKPEAISIKMRGGIHSDQAPELGCVYLMGVRFDGSVNAQYECPHPQNHDLPGHGGPGKIKLTQSHVLGRKIGVMMRCIPSNGVDNLSCYVDIGSGWKLFHSTSSSQFFGKCNGGGDERTFFRIDEVNELGDPYAAVAISSPRYRRL